MIKTGNPVYQYLYRDDAQPGTMKFVANKLLYPGKSIDFADEASAKPSPWHRNSSLFLLSNPYLSPAILLRSPKQRKQRTGRM